MNATAERSRSDARTMTESTTRSAEADTFSPDTAEARDEIRLGRLDGYIGFHLRMAQTASFRAVRERSGYSNLRPGWFAVLSIIGDNPGIAPAALSRAAGRDKSTLTPVLRDLLKERYLEQKPRPGDRRSYRLYLTPAGRAYAEEIAAHATEHERILDRIAGEKKDEFIRFLRRITEEMS
jgi:DNA-binding MarR family transcriptional regulator